MVPKAEDLRAEIARKQWNLYQLAAKVCHHPARLGQMLRERIPLPADLAVRIQAALRESGQE